MLDVVFIKKSGEIELIDVDEESYEKMAKIGLSQIMKFSRRNILFDGEIAELSVATLKFGVRYKFKVLIENEIFSEICKLERILDNPTVKEVRESTIYLIVLNKIRECIIDKSNRYFSFE